MRIGIDVGGTKIAGIVLDAHGTALLARRLPTPTGAGYQAVLSAIAGLALDIEAEVGVACTIGVGSPGQPSAKDGRIKNSNATCLNGEMLQRDLESQLRRPIRLANDANCFCLSEAVDGAVQGARVAFGVIIGTGVGGGISIDRQILAGRHGIAGEWGHSPLGTGGPACYCGRRGCIETMLSGPGLLLDYRVGGGSRAEDAAAVAALAERGEDPFAEAAVARYCERFGQAMAGIVNLLDPDAIVLGGGLSNMRALYDRGVAAMNRHVFNDCMTTPVLRHRHGDASGVRGAAMLWPPSVDAAAELGANPIALAGQASAVRVARGGAGR